MAYKLIITISVSIALSGCAPRPDAPLVARWSGGDLTRTELDRHIIELAEIERAVDPDDPVAWWMDRARDAILDELLLASIDTEGDTEIAAALRDEMRRLVVDAELLRRHGPVAEPTELELREAWAELEGTMNTPERRQLFNIYRRATDRGSREAAVRELQLLRARILSGEAFGSIAEELSDSESRHRRGIVGVFEQGQLDPQLERIVFELEPETPSEPVTTNDGAHLFMVRIVVPEQSATFEESRPALIRHLQNEATWTRMEETAVELYTPSDADIVLAAEDLARSLRSPENNVVLKIGAFSMTRSEWLEWSQTHIGSQSDATQQIRGYLGVARGEMILQTVLATTGLDTATEDRLAAVERRLKAQQQLELALRNAVTDDELAGYFSANSNRFAVSGRSQLQKFEAPLGENPVRTMAALERARESIARGDLTLEELARETGGVIDDLGWVSGARLARILPTAPTSVFGLSAGQVGHPFSTGQSLAMLAVVAVEPATTPSLDEVRPQVVARYINDERPRLVKRLQRDLLEEAGVEFDPEWLESIE